MSATASLQVTRRPGLIFQFPVAAAVKTLIGTIAALDADDDLVLATDAASRRVVGLFVSEVDNTDGADGDLVCDVEAGCFLLANSGDNAVTDAHIGKVCFVEDNETVASAAGTNAVVAGIVAKVTSDGVWVHIGPHLARVPITVSTIAAADATNEASAVTLANELKTDFNALHAALKQHGLVK
jgi:hypothetical protein